jgi:hypothetical protein
MTELTPLPDLVHDAARAGPVRTRRPVWATYEEMATRGAARFPPDARPAPAASVSG